uniref:Protein kinase domain-containing protein n=1 Tax=Kalanchoe fedtschenkoi TaxID=63787 RepID=A0A7N0TKD5_KALFE
MKYLSCRADSAVSTSDSSKTAPQPSIKIQHFNYSDLQAATGNFSDSKLLGRGSHGTVYKAVLRNGRPVAVKKSAKNLSPGLPSSSLSSGRVNEVDNEIDILSNIRSPRLVNLVGFSNDRRDRLLVVEFMSNGTLYDVLHSNPRPPNWGRRIRLALQTAKAVQILHASSPPVIHRDIKSANVLLDRSFNARLGDFGLALRCHVNDYRLKSTPPAGTMGYLDPAYVTPDNLSTKSDVFSFGILLFEIISGRKAIDVAHSPPSIVDWAVPLVKKGKLSSIYDPRIPPLKDLVVRKQLTLIAAKCVRSCRERRPSMNEVVDWLSGLNKLVPLHTWNNFNNPCMMVETVGHPVEVKNGQLGSQLNEEESQTVDGGAVIPVNRKSRRVYSDLGVKNNLMELMAETEAEEAEADGVDANPKLANWSSSSRFGSGRYAVKGRSSARPQSILSE